MNRKARRTGKALTGGSFTAADVERRLNAIIRAGRDVRPWFHGGAPGLQPGDLLQPGAATGNRHGWGLDSDAAEERQFVYITRYREFALRYAVSYPGREGTLYVVEPIGAVTVDPYDVRSLTRPESRADLVTMLSGRFHPIGCRCRSARVVSIVGQPWHAPPGSPLHVNEQTRINGVPVGRLADGLASTRGRHSTQEPAMDGLVVAR